MQFELVAELNRWGERTKALQLAASLRGPAQSVLADIEENKRRVYKSVVNSLEQRFGRANQTELFRTLLRNRSRKQGESIPELAHDIQRLLARAYPNASVDMKRTLAKEFFVDAIGDSDSRWKIYQSRPRNLEEAVSIAVELEAFTLAEQKKAAPPDPAQKKFTVRAVTEEKEVKKAETAEEGLGGALGIALAKGFSELTEHITALMKKEQRKNASPPYENRAERLKSIKCWNCGEMGHYKNNCPLPTNDESQSISMTKKGNEQKSAL